MGRRGKDQNRFFHETREKMGNSTRSIRLQRTEICSNDYSTISHLLLLLLLGWLVIRIPRITAIHVGILSSGRITIIFITLSITIISTSPSPRTSTSTPLVWICLRLRTKHTESLQRIEKDFDVSADAEFNCSVNIITCLFAGLRPHERRTF